jgi:hypothetical protein
MLETPKSFSLELPLITNMVELMKMALTLVAFLCFTVAASATPNNATAGPYQISFNLTATKDFVIQTQDPIIWNVTDPSWRTYSAKIITKYSPEATISIVKYSSPISESMEDEAEDIAKMWRSLSQDVIVEYQTIDDHPGFIIKTLDKLNRADYTASYRLSELEEVNILSNLPDTSSLLNTIHVQKIT